MNKDILNSIIAILVIKTIENEDLFIIIEKDETPMQITQKIFYLAIISMLSCTSQEYLDQHIVLKENFQNKGHELIYQAVEKVGSLDLLRYEKKDVIATYKLDKPEGKSDISMEKYIFDGELSYGKYYRHDYTLPALSDEIIVAYDGNATWLTHKSVITQKPDLVNAAQSIRSNNYYWFIVLQKLLDPDLFYDYLGDRNIGDNDYDVVMVTLDPEGIKSSNQYHVYINKETGIVDQLIYDSESLSEEYGPRLIQMEYEAIDGVLLPTKRRYKKSNWNADIDDSPWTYETWSEVSFQNELTREDFKNTLYL